MSEKKGTSGQVSARNDDGESGQIGKDIAYWAIWMSQLDLRSQPVPFLLIVAEKGLKFAKAKVGEIVQREITRPCPRQCRWEEFRRMEWRYFHVDSEWIQ